MSNNSRSHKRELAKRTANVCSASQTLTMKIVNEFLTQWAGALIQTGRVEFRNFGVFTVRRRAARMGRDIHRGVAVEIPPRWDITFKPSDNVLKDLTNWMSDLDVRAAIERAANGGRTPKQSQLKPLDLSS